MAIPNPWERSTVCIRAGTCTLFPGSVFQHDHCIVSSRHQRCFHRQNVQGKARKLILVAVRLYDLLLASKQHCVCFWKKKRTAHDTLQCLVYFVCCFCHEKVKIIPVKCHERGVTMGMSAL